MYATYKPFHTCNYITFFKFSLINDLLNRQIMIDVIFIWWFLSCRYNGIIYIHNIYNFIYSLNIKQVITAVVGYSRFNVSVEFLSGCFIHISIFLGFRFSILFVFLCLGFVFRYGVIQQLFFGDFNGSSGDARRWGGRVMLLLQL